MQTLANVLLMFLLLGADTGEELPDATPAQDATASHITLFDGATLQVQPHRVTVEVSAVWSPDTVTASAAVPRWLMALSARVQALAMTRLGTAAFDAPAPLASPAGP